MLNKILKSILTIVIYSIFAIVLFSMFLGSAAASLPKSLSNMYGVFELSEAFIQLFIYVTCTYIFYIIWYKNKTGNVFKSILLSALISTGIILILFLATLLLYLALTYTGC